MPEIGAPPEWLEQVLRHDKLRWQCLQCVRDELGCDFWLAAGFIRNLVWDMQHGHATPTPLADIDVIYLSPFLSLDLCRRQERHYQWLLQQQLDLPWQVRNQARMAAEHGHLPYPDCTAAIARWPETATCYAVQLDENECLHWLAPLGWAPLLSLQVVRNSAFTGGDTAWQQRLTSKNWQQRWPQLQLMSPDK